MELKDKTWNTFVLISQSTRTSQGCGQAPTSSETYENSETGGTSEMSEKCKTSENNENSCY